MNKLIIVIISVFIGTFQVILRQDFFNFLNIMDIVNSLIYIVVIFGIMIGLSSYFSNWKARYVFSNVILSILIGHAAALFPLFLAEKITEITILNGEQNFMILTLAKFGALPSLAISVGINPKRKNRLKEDFSWRRKTKD